MKRMPKYGDYGRLLLPMVFYRSGSPDRMVEAGALVIFRWGDPQVYGIQLADTPPQQWWERAVSPGDVHWLSPLEVLATAAE